MVDKVLTKASEVKRETSMFLNGAIKLVMTLSLIIVSAAAAYLAHSEELPHVVANSILFAAAVILVQAGWLLQGYLRQLGGK